ncbi:MAG: ribonuclease H-like domain-containing protein, partial [Candidatus Zixiibacteriota bacterium]
MLRNKLGRYSQHIVNSPDNSTNTPSGSRYHKLAECLDGDLIERSNGTFVKITSTFDEDYFHGKFVIPQRDNLPTFRKKYFEKADEKVILDPERFLFFDTETTGLGGSGTVAFLIGFGSLKGNGFEVRQYFLPDFPDEEAMLEAAREEIRPDTILVSYNGRAFDIPIITDRMIIQRVERNLEYADHIDLLHTVRRLYRRRIKNCNLSNVEQRILDYYRTDDIPGYLVPSMYFNWLATDDTNQLDLIAEHNLNDIVSLYFIMSHIAAVHESPAERITDPDDVLSLARIMERRK